MAPQVSIHEMLYSSELSHPMAGEPGGEHCLAGRAGSRFQARQSTPSPSSRLMMPFMQTLDKILRCSTLPLAGKEKK